VLHKIEGDAGNSRYGYSQTTHTYSKFADAKQELATIKREEQRGPRVRRTEQ
jgi:hypothetical protein